MSVVIGDKTYGTVVIGNREWMSENLDYNIGTGSGSANPSLGFRYYDVDTETNYDETYVAGLKFGKYYAATVPFWWDVYKRGSAALKSEIPTNYKNFFDSIPAGWRLPTAADFEALGIPNYDDEEYESVNLDPALCVNQTECTWGGNFNPTNTSGLSLVPSSGMSLETIDQQDIHLVWMNTKKDTIDLETDKLRNLYLAGELKIKDIEQVGTPEYSITADYYLNADFVANETSETAFTNHQSYFDSCYVEDSETEEWVKPTGQDFLNWLEDSDFYNIRLVRDYVPPTYTATITAGYGGSVSQASIADIASGTAISTSTNTLTIGDAIVNATANNHYRFKDWTKADGTALPATITADIAIKANFETKPTEKQWAEVEISEFAEMIPDVVRPDCSDVVAVLYDEQGRWLPLDYTVLANLYMAADSEECYNVNPIGENLFTMYLPKWIATHTIRLIYNSDVDIQGDTELNLPALHTELLIQAVTADLMADDGDKDPMQLERENAKTTALEDLIRAKTATKTKRIERQSILPNRSMLLGGAFIARRFR